MKSKHAWLVLLVFCLFSFTSAQKIVEMSDVKQVDSQLFTFAYDSGAISAGSRKPNVKVNIVVLLPDSYALQPLKRYPVVYTLHGHSSPTDQLVKAIRPYTQLPENKSLEFITVGIEGSNTFYADSLTNGFGQKMIVDEVIPLIDSYYRTIASNKGRVIAGFSMGGYGAWSIALSHPELFSYGWSVCPGAFDAKSLREATKTWSSGFYEDYSTTFAAELFQPGKRIEKPKFDGSNADNGLIQLLEQGFGGIDQKLTAFSVKNVKLSKIRFDIGSFDYDWLSRGSKFVSQKMAEAGIPITLEEHNSGHQISDAMIQKGFFPLMREVLANLP